MKIPKIFTSLDLEMNQPSGKIIQIGAVVGDVTEGKILDSLCIHINPEERLTEYIKTLTNISQEQVDKGVSLLDGYKKLKTMHERYGSFMNPITWGGGDSQELNEQLGKLTDENWCFGRRWIDVKTLYVSYRIANQESIPSGLSKSMNKMGLSFDGRKHNAKDDAANTFVFYCHLLKLLKKT